MNFENLLDNLAPKVSRRENLGTSWLLDLQGFKNYNCNPFLSSSILSIRGSFVFPVLLTPLLNVLSPYFYVSLSLVAVPTI